MKSIKITWPLLVAGTAIIASCSLPEKYEEGWNQLYDRVEKLDSVIDQETGRLHHLDSLVDEEIRRIEKLDSLITN